MSNFAFLPQALHGIAEAAQRAEGHVNGDPRAACFHARFALEALVHWLYRFDSSLRMPYDQSLGALLHEPSFRNLLPQAVFQKARVIQKQGNQAVHRPQPVLRFDALQVVKELHHLCYWLVRTYAPDSAAGAAPFDEELIADVVPTGDVVPRKRLERLEARLAKQHEEQLERQHERDELDRELQALRAELERVRDASVARPDTHDYSEAETRTHLIDLDLKRAGWALDQPRDREYEVTGMPNQQGVGYVDYVLWGEDGKPLAVVEAKRTTVDPTVGQQQAKLYADCLQQMHGQRPVIFYTNGYETWMWDDLAYPPRRVAGFYKRDELHTLVLRRTQRTPVRITDLNTDIVDRPYQKRAIASIAAHFAQAQRKGLLVMATGTGKTRTAIAMVDLLQRAGVVKRALFLADRISLVRQAVGAFKTHLPESSPVNLVTDKQATGRVYVCTYPTMMGLIDETDGDAARFGVGHFDLVIIDEAHRSVYERYSAIFRYFDSLLVGLTATPSDQVDRNTYELFDLENGVPTDAYELQTAVDEGYLVRPKARPVDSRFPREGIAYDDLSEEEQAEWERLDWGEDGEPRLVNAAAVNNWLFNKDTVDKVLKHLMKNGHKVAGGDRLAKTILFARNHDHAKFVEDRFNHHYPHLRGQFARVIDHQVKYAQDLIDKFSIKEENPHLAISVDMLDTGIDVPEVANLVFFKPVYSKIKFWQMIGRGTRLCPDLFGPGMDKEDFRIFDFCGNFEFFKENPQGIDSSSAASLGTRLFRCRVELIGVLQSSSEVDPDGALRASLTAGLHGEVNSMNRENFLVREQLETVERFQRRDSWNRLSESDQHLLQDRLADLPNELEAEEMEARHFDLIALRMQLALLAGNAGSFERLRLRVVEMAALLEEQTTIPQVAAQLDYLAELQSTSFWAGIDVQGLEQMRLRLRGLVSAIQKTKRTIVYTNFRDEFLNVHEEADIYAPQMTGAQYEKKVREYLKQHQDHLVIARLRCNEPLTRADLAELERVLVEIGENNGQSLLSGLVERTASPSLPYLVRRLVGLDRATAQAAFAGFLSDRSLDDKQIRFIEMVIDQLSSRGVLEAESLYDPPFTSLHSGGPDELFAGRDAVVQGVFDQLRTLSANLSA